MKQGPSYLSHVLGDNEYASRADVKRAWIEANLTTCKLCKERCFWARTSKGNKILMNLNSDGLHKTHELVPTSQDGHYIFPVESWPTSHNPTHSVHWNTCKGAPMKPSRR